jgi:hypothetical protein
MGKRKNKKKKGLNMLKLERVLIMYRFVYFSE